MADWFDEELSSLKKRIKWEIKELGDVEKKLEDFEPPPVNIQQVKGELVIKVKLPDVSREDVKLKIASDSFEVRAEKKGSLEVKKKGNYKSEKDYKRYYRMLALPAKVDHKKARVEFKGGVLKVSVPKLKK